MAYTYRSARLYNNVPSRLSCSIAVKLMNETLMSLFFMGYGVKLTTLKINFTLVSHSPLTNPKVKTFIN